MSTASAAIQDGHVPLDTDRIVGRSRLLGDLRDRIRRKHDSIRTEQAYLPWAKRFMLFHGKRHPNEMGEAKIVAFLNHRAGQRNVAALTQSQALDALVFPGATPRAAALAQIAERSGGRDAAIVAAYATGADADRDNADHFGPHLATMACIGRSGMQ